MIATHDLFGWPTISLAAAWKPILECLHPALLILFFNRSVTCLSFLLQNTRNSFWPLKYAKNVSQYFLFSCVDYLQNVGRHTVPWQHV